MPSCKAFLVCGGAALALISFGAKAFDRNALGVVVATCRAHKALRSSPSPCLAVEVKEGIDGGYAVLREPTSKQRTILVALSAISGIEDPRLLDENGPNFFASAWKERGWLLDEVTASDPWHGFSLAINPRTARSQDRLHVHLNCLRPSVQSAVAKHLPAINPKMFAPLGFKLQGRTLWGMRVPGSDLKDMNPLHILAEKMPGAREAMGDHLLMVVAERMPNGDPTFALLTNDPVKPGAPMFSVESFFNPAC